MTRRAKSLADMSDADLVAQRDRLNDEIERRKGEAQSRLDVLGASKIKTAFLNPRKVEPLVPFDPGIAIACTVCHGSGVTMLGQPCTACASWRMTNSPQTANEITVRPDAQDSNAEPLSSLSVGVAPITAPLESCGGEPDNGERSSTREGSTGLAVAARSAGNQSSLSDPLEIPAFMRRTGGEG